MSDMTFGDWIKRQRLSRRMTQEDLETAADLGEKYISKVERGRLHLPGDDVRSRIHHVLGTSDDDLVRSGILERIDAQGYDPVYIPPARRESALRVVRETEARYDDVDARTRLRLRAESLTEPQAAAILSLLEAFAPER